MIPIDDSNLASIAVIERDGIGFIGSVPCVAAWFVPYVLPETIGVRGRQPACDIGPMRGSLRGIHARLPGDDSQKRIHEGRYYTARKMGRKISQRMKSRDTNVLRMMLSKPHWTYQLMPSGPAHRCWCDEFFGGFRDDREVSIFDDVKLIGQWLSPIEYLLVYVPDPNREKTQAVFGLLDECVKSAQAQTTGARQ